MKIVLEYHHDNGSLYLVETSRKKSTCEVLDYDKKDLKLGSYAGKLANTSKPLYEIYVSPPEGPITMSSKLPQFRKRMYEDKDNPSERLMTHYTAMIHWKRYVKSLQKGTRIVQKS